MKRILGLMACMVLALAVPSSAQVVSTIPGVIQVKDYQQGGEGVAYHDNSPDLNKGKACRMEGVDIKTLPAEGCVIGWVGDGEWIKYDVSIQQTGTYDFTSRVARGVAGQGTLHVELDGQDITGPVAVPSTGDWLTFTDVSVQNVQLTQGTRELRLFFDTSNMDVSWMKFAQVGAPPNEATVALAWDANTETDLAGYKVHHGTASGTYDVVVDVANVTAHTVGNLSRGTRYYFAVSAYDSSGNESGVSNEVFADITAPDITPPDVPGGLRIEKIEISVTINIGQ